MEDFTQLLHKMKNHVSNLEKDNKILKEEIRELKKKYAEETEIILKLDKKIYDLTIENNQLKLK